MKRKYFTFKPFIDVLFCCLLMLVAILYLLKTEEDQVKTRPPNVIYEVVLTWHGQSNDDLDIHVKTASGHMVWFGNREGSDGSLAALTHDALGRRNNQLSTTGGVITQFHEEVVQFRGVSPGENIVNIHVYRKEDEGPIACTVKLIKIKPYKEIIVKKLQFEATGDQKTVFRFVTNKAGTVIDINYLPINLVTALPQ